MKSIKDPRHKARMRLVENLYAKRVNPETQELPDNIYKFDKDLYSRIFTVINDHTDEIESLIEDIAQRKIKDIKNIEYIILLISLSESYFSDITPYKVAIDEAIELSREYGDEASAQFIAGVLGAAFDKKNKTQS